MKRAITVLLVSGLLLFTMVAQALAADNTQRQTQMHNYTNLDQGQQEMVQSGYQYVLQFMHQCFDEPVLTDAVQKFDRIRLQLKDGSCLDTTVIQKHDQDRLQLRDGSCLDADTDVMFLVDILADQNQDRDWVDEKQTKYDQDPDQDRDQKQTQAPLRDGSCKLP